MEYEEIKDTILCNFEPCSGHVENAQNINGEWYAPLWGCDTLCNLLDDLKTAMIKESQNKSDNSAMVPCKYHNVNTKWEFCLLQKVCGKKPCMVAQHQ